MDQNILIQGMELYLIFAIAVINCPISSVKIIPGKGNFTFNGIFSIIDLDNNINYQSGVMMAEALKYAIEMVNDKKDYLYGYKFKVGKIYDSTREADVRKDILNTFMHRVPFLIGPYSSQTSYISSILVGTFTQVAVTYSATYSDFEPVHSNMVRTVPSDKFRVHALLDLILKLEWNYLSVISSYGYNGKTEAVHFISKLSSIGVCLAYQIDLPQNMSTTTYEQNILSIDKDDRLKGVVLFTTKKDSRNIFLAIRKLKLINRFYLICMYGCTNYIEVVKGIEEVAVGTLSLDVHYNELQGFKDYFLRQNPEINKAKYFRRYWESIFNCSLEANGAEQKCTGKETFSTGIGYYPLTPVHTVVNAINAIAYAVRIYVKSKCNENSGGTNAKKKSSCIVNANDGSKYSYHISQYLKQMSYKDGSLRKKYTSLLPDNSSTVQYDIHRFLADSDNGTYKNVLVGIWQMDRQKKQANPMFYKDIVLTQKAVCSLPCPAGYVPNRDYNCRRAQCCWNCSKCPPNSIVINDTCNECKDEEMAVLSLNLCSPLPTRSIQSEKHPVYMVLFTLSILGLCLVSSVVLVFVRYNNTRIIRSSGREMCYMILFGLCLTFICPITYITKPSVASCMVRGTLPGLALLTCYVPLFLKIYRIYRIFCHAKVSKSPPLLINSQSLLLISLIIIIIQVLFSAAWFASKIPEPETIVSSSETYVTIHCQGEGNPMLLLLHLPLNIIFMIFCTILAFKTRNFPKNYNETKYIGITLYMSLVVWAMFIPGYLLIKNTQTDFLREYLMGGLCVATGYITLFGLFGQKLDLIFCHVPDNRDGKVPTTLLSCSESNEMSSELNGGRHYVEAISRLNPI